jgi:hypothetical protein
LLDLRAKSVPIALNRDAVSDAWCLEGFGRKLVMWFDLPSVNVWHRIERRGALENRRLPVMLFSASRHER